MNREVEIPTRWIEVDQQWQVFLKDDEKHGSSYFFIGLTRWNNVLLTKPEDFGLTWNIDTDEPYIQLDEDAKWNDDDGNKSGDEDDTEEIEIEEPKKIAIDGLYGISIEITEYSGHKNVVMAIIRWNTKNLPFNPEDYLPEHIHLTGDAKEYTLECLRECFTMDEIEQIKEYLSKFKNTTVGVPHPCIIYEDGSLLPRGMFPASSGEGDYYCYYKDKNYLLRFEIGGYFDLRQHEKLSSKKEVE